MEQHYWDFLNKNKYHHWKGYCNKERNSAISDMESIINAHGFIIDFHMFSDIEICINIEIEECKVFDLYTSLINYISLNEIEEFSSNSKNECKVLLNVTFTKATGNLRIEVPAVPG